MSEQILDVPLVDIEAPEGWNARSGAWADDVADPTSDDGGYEGLKASMQAAKRNDEPVLLRPNPRHDSTFPDGIPKYLIVDGFRRLHVARELQWPTIRATVEELSDFEARRRNLAAQSGRLKHKPADLAWGIAEMKRLGKPDLRHEDIGDMLGISSNYTGTLLRIMSRMDPKVVQAWRASSVHVQINDLERLIKLPPEEHWKAWETLILQTKTPLVRSTFSDFRIEKRAKDLGRTIGALQRLDVVYAATHGRLTPALPLITRKVLTPEQIEKLETIMGEGFAEGLAGKDIT